MIAAIRFLPESDNRDGFDFHHWQDHLALVQAANNQFGTKLSTYVIFPAPDHDTWLKLHQAYHDDLAKVLKIAPTDLKSLDPDDKDARTDWSWRNYQFHSAAHAVLRI